MSERTAKAIKKARSEYQREWRKRNPGKNKEYLNRYWERRVMREQVLEKEKGKHGSKSVYNALNELRKTEKQQRISLDDTETVKETALAYIESCAITSTFPCMSNLAQSLGYTRAALYAYMEKHGNSETGRFLLQLHDLFASIIAENGMRNNSNPVVSIFLLKALFGFKDTQTFELLQGSQINDTVPVNEIALRADLLSDD